MLTPIILANGSWTRILVPLDVVNRLVSGVLVHRLLVVIIILTKGLLRVLSHWRLWVLGIGLLVVLSRELLLRVLSWGLLVNI